MKKHKHAAKNRIGAPASFRAARRQVSGGALVRVAPKYAEVSRFAAVRARFVQVVARVQRAATAHPVAALALVAGIAGGLGFAGGLRARR